MHSTFLPIKSLFMEAMQRNVSVIKSYSTAPISLITVSPLYQWSERRVCALIEMLGAFDDVEFPQNVWSNGQFQQKYPYSNKGRKPNSLEILYLLLSPPSCRCWLCLLLLHWRDRSRCLFCVCGFLTHLLCLVQTLLSISLPLSLLVCLAECCMDQTAAPPANVSNDHENQIQKGQKDRSSSRNPPHTALLPKHFNQRERERSVWPLKYLKYFEREITTTVVWSSLDQGVVNFNIG